MMRQTAVGCRRPGRSHSFRSTSTETACCRPFARPRPPVRCRPRGPCRRVPVARQMGAMVLAATLALLVQTGAIQVWHVYIFATLLGIVTALDMPAQQAFIGDLSGMEQVRQAVVINNMLFQVSRMLGPALAGLVVAQLGAAPALWLKGGSFLAGL